MPALRLYFAYGSNMDPERMLARCPRSSSVGRGRIRHRRFLINTRGVATISPERDATVWGGVWAISARDEAMLDRFEGFPQAYWKEQLPVTMPDGKRCRALVYVDPVSAPGWPRPGYLERIVRGARAFRLPEAYIARIIEPFSRHEQLPLAC